MVCPRCGADNAASNRFCGNCGSVLTAEVTGTYIPADDRTPESWGEAGLTYAGFWRRVAAYFVDFGVLILPATVVGIILAVSSPFDLWTLAASMQAAMAVLAWLYFAGMESSSRQGTLGKIALGIRVTDLSGRRIGFGRATIRHILKAVTSVFFFPAYLIIVFTRRKQGLHDMAVGTTVVVGSAETSPGPSVRVPPRQSLPGWGVALLIAGCVTVPLGIGLAIGIPAYRDYAVSRQVEQGMALASEYQQKVAEALALDVPPGALTTESLQLAPVESGDVESIEVAGGVVIVTFAEAANALIATKKLLLVPGVGDADEVEWACGYAPAPDGVRLVLPAHVQYTTVPRRYLPDQCRGQQSR